MSRFGGRNLVGVAGTTVSSFEKQDLPKEEAGLDRTLSLIDTFLSSLPEEPVVMELPMDVTTDYTSFLFLIEVTKVPLPTFQ